MTLTIILPPDLEEELRSRASANGQGVAEYVVYALEEKLRGKPTVDEILAPFRKQVEASGMTDDELGSFWDEMREEVWQDKHGNRP